MKSLYIENPEKIRKNKLKLEKELNIKITLKGEEIIIDGEAEEEYFAEKIIDALSFGFNFNEAILIKNEDFLFEILDIKEYTKRKDLHSVRARIIGKGGKVLKVLNTLTKCELELNDNRLGVIGPAECIKNAQEAITSLIRGAKHSNVYAFLEKHQVKPILDLGLKEKKSKKQR